MPPTRRRDALGVHSMDCLNMSVPDLENARRFWTRTLRTRSLVGADGADSPVREAPGIGREDRGFQADWLVVDMKLNPGVAFDIPDCGQYWARPPCRASRRAGPKRCDRRADKA